MPRVLRTYGNGAWRRRWHTTKPMHFRLPPGVLTWVVRRVTLLMARLPFFPMQMLSRCSVLLLVLVVTAAKADIFSVTATTDTGSGSDGSGDLRYCITTAAATPGSNLIIFDNTVFATAQTITLTGELVPGASTTIDASRLANGVTLTGGGAHRIFSVASGVSLTVNGLTLTGGNGAGAASSGSGGAIYNMGALVLNGCTLSGNTVPDGGGAIDSEGASATATLTNCTLTGNTANYGGAINTSSSALTLIHCTVAVNTSTGGMVLSGGTATLRNTIVAGNTAGSGATDVDLGGGGTTVTMQGNNLLGQNSVGAAYNTGALATGSPNSSGNYVGTNGAPVAANLKALGSYGGPVQTMPPLIGTTAVDAVTTANIVPGLNTDARGNARSIDGKSSGTPLPDIGATEFVPDTFVTVSTTSDSGVGSLRQAIANSEMLAPAPRSIAFNSALAGQTITLASTITVDIINPAGLTLDATGLSGGLTISGAGAGGNFGIFSIGSDATVTFKGLNLTNGGGSGFYGLGGAIYNDGTLTLTQCTLSGNSTGGNDCGAIYNFGTMTLNQCTLSDNSAKYSGGAIYNNWIMGLNQCTLSGNSTASGDGGAIYNAVILTLTNCIVAGNSAPTGHGADIYNNGGAANGIVTRVGANLVQSLVDANGGTDSGPAAIAMAPNLAPLGSYGGPTQTMPPLFGSPAINAAVGSTFTTDQRGLAVVDGMPDLGAAESLSEVVENLNDSGPGSLRQVITNAAATSHTVTFPAGFSGQTITLASTINLSGDMIIDAGGLPGGVTLSGEGKNGTFGLFTTGSGSTVVFKCLTLANGGGSGFDGDGAAINNAGTLILTQCNFYSNTSTGLGGAIFSDGGTLMLEQCTLSGNTAYHGGAISSNSPLTLVQCTLSSNTASSIQGAGGAISSSGPLTLTQCTLSGNSANNGGGCHISLPGGSTFTQCTICGNSVTGIGGGVYNDVYPYQGGIFHLSNTIVAVNTAPAGPDLAGPATSQGGNLIGDGTGSSGLTNGVMGDQMGTRAQPVDPLLAPLGNYGGPTQTMPPLVGSPAINTAVGSTFTTDQRGVAIADLMPDIGAAEAVFSKVKNTSDSGPGSLRQALIDAATSGHAVSFAPALNGATITPAGAIDSLGNAFILSTGMVVDAGGLPGGITINGALGNFRLFSSNPGTDVFFKGLTLANGGGSSFSGNGGAIINGGTMTLLGCTLFGNSSGGYSFHLPFGSGGAVYNEGTLTLLQCTLSGNSTAFGGGGGALNNSGTLTLNQCTVSGNSAGTGGGIESFGAQLYLINSIVAGNVAAAYAPDIDNVAGILTPTGVNLIGDLTSTGLSASSTLLTGSANLAPLGNYGGPTQTMPPLTGSPAIDPAGGATTPPFSTDQRGLPRLEGASVDLGAVEIAPATDFSPGVVSFQYGLYSVKQSVGTAQVPVVRTGPGLVAVTLVANATPGTANNSDFVEVTNQLVTFGVGQTVATVAVMIEPDTSPTEPNESFTLTLAGGGVTYGTPNVCTVRILAVDTKPPTVTLTSPAAGLVVTQPTANLTGSTTDDKGVADVQYSLNGSAFTPVQLTPDSTGLSATFSQVLTSVPGPNTVSVRAHDTSGNVSAAVTHTFSYKVMTPLTVTVTVGGPANSGTVTTGFLGTSQRSQGFPFTITATPKAGFVFNGWTANSFTGTGVTSAAAQVPALTCVMQPGLLLTANFIANPFTQTGILLTGAYNGLVTPSAAVPAPTGTVQELDTLGMLQNAVVTSTGSFTGSLKISGASFPVTGVFDNTGVARFGTGHATALSLARAGKPDLNVALQLDMNGINGISGSVTQLARGNVITSSSTVAASRAWYNGTTSKAPASLAGTSTKPYTLIFPSMAQSPALDPQYYPQADGCATMTVNINGTVSLTGKLADNTAISASSPLAKPVGNAIQWPVFAQLYALSQGCVAGIATLDDSQTDTDATATLTWLRPYQDGQWYPSGWANGIQVGLLATKYVLPPATPPTSVFPGLNPGIPSDTANATLTFSEGLLTASVSNTVHISPANAVAHVPLNSSFTMAITKATGMITGTFTHTNGTLPGWQAVILNKGANKGARGFFMTTSPKVPNGTGQDGEVQVTAD